MKKYIILSLIVLLVVPAILSARVAYLSEEDYKKLKKKERLVYWENLENDLAELQQRKADAIADQEKYTTAIDEVTAKKAADAEEYQIVYNEIMTLLEVDNSEVTAIERKISTLNRQISNLEKLSDKELWKAKKNVRELIADYKEYRESNQSKVPEFRMEFSDLDNKIANLDNSLEAAKPKYYEDSYTIVKGDWLSKIAAYNFIYNDMSKWPIIYRANRDQIKDPNLIYPDQVIKIPRGLPYSWKVYKGECLWKIAGYPEVYDNPAQWPMIYRANKDKIKNPDLIYPNQVFEIPRD